MEWVNHSLDDTSTNAAFCQYLAMPNINKATESKIFLRVISSDRIIPSILHAFMMSIEK